MRNKIYFVGYYGVRGIARLAIACSVLVSPVLADANTCTAGNAAQQMACLRMENAVLGERLAQATLLKNIAKQSNTVKTARKLGFPSVLSTYGINGKMDAVLVWTRRGKNVGSMITHAGSAIPGGWHVTQIVNGTVVVQKGPKSRTLLLSNGSTSSQQISLPGGANGAGGTYRVNHSVPYGVQNPPVISAPITNTVR